MNKAKHSAVLFAIFLTAMTLGCTKDRVGTYETDGGDAGSSQEVGGDADGGDIGPDAGDVGPDADGGPEPDTNIGVDAPIVPDEPAATTHCNDENWCWLHPTPFPHRVTDLQRVGDRVFGVATAYKLRGRQGVIWDGTSLELVPKPVPPGEFLQDMTTSNDGWLALDDNGVVHDFGPEGERDTRQLPSGEHRHLSGNSLNSFIVHGEYPEAHVMRDGRLVTQSLPEDMQRRSVMWANGEIWGIRLPGREYLAYLDGTWRIFVGSDVGDYPAMGPSPDSACSSEGVFTATDDGDLYRWDDVGMGFAPVAYDGSLVTSIGCSPDGDLILTDDKGRILTRTGEAIEPWTRTDALERPVEDTEVAGSELHISGIDGEHARVSGDDVTHLGGGFRAPSDQLPDDPHHYFHSVWVDDAGGEIILSHSAGAYRGTEAGWSRMPVADEDLTYRPLFKQFYSAHGDLFALSESRLWRWDGTRWVNITESALGTQQIAAHHSMVGPDGNLWLKWPLVLVRYDGQAWTNLTDEGTPLEESLDASDLRIGNVFSSYDGEVVVSTEGATHTLSRQAGEWTLTKRRDVPCEGLDAYHEGRDGSVWVVGGTLRRCVAGFVDGEWTTYEYPAEEMRPPDDYGPDTVSWLPQPGSDVPLLTHEYGLLEPQSDGTLQPEFIGQISAGTHVPGKNANVVLTLAGAIVKYYR